jgi:hypothetical protein
MSAFLIITSLSLAFYLGLLVVLYYDGRKRRPSGESVYKLQAGSAAELGPLPKMVYAGSSRQQGAAKVLVRFAVNSGRGRLKSQSVGDKPAKVITLSTFARDNNEAQCGRSTAKGIRVCVTSFSSLRQ